MDGRAQVKGLQAPATGIPVSKLLLHALQHPLVGANRLAHHQLAGVFQRLANLFAAGHLAHPGVPALSLSTTRLRVKNGAWAPLRFISMLSRPATGMARSSVTTGVEDGVMVRVRSS